MGRDNIKMDLDWIYLAQDRNEMAQCCKHGHELPGGNNIKTDLDWIYLAQDRNEMAQCCKHGHELPGGIILKRTWTGFI